MLRSSYYLQQLRDILYIAPVVLIAIMGHEFAHGWVSDRLGDPTPRMDGRLTLNPLKHLDPFGTLCLIFFRMGWAKPVRINTASGNSKCPYFQHSLGICETAAESDSQYPNQMSFIIMQKGESGLPGSRCRFPGTRLLILKQMSENPSHKRPRKKYLPAECHGKVQNRCLKPFCDNLGIHPFKKKRSDKTHQRTHDTHRHG